VAWLVHSDEPEPLEIRDAWIPHGQFRGEGHLPLALRLPGGGSVRLDFLVSSQAPAGTVVHNAFLILQMYRWRVFARMRVEFDAEARPRPIVEVVTSQSIQ
jgi:hypothetical protein